MAKQISYLGMDHFSTDVGSSLNSFVDGLMKGNPDMTRRNNIVEELNSAINHRLTTLLNDEDAKELQELINDEAPDDIIEDFVETKIPNFESEVAAVLLNYKNAQKGQLNA